MLEIKSGSQLYRCNGAGIGGEHVYTPLKILASFSKLLTNTRFPLFLEISGLGARASLIYEEFIRNFRVG